MVEQVERLVNDAIGAVLGTDAGDSAKRQEEIAKKVAEAIVALLTPRKREAA